jgi:hypothetical protein
LAATAARMSSLKAGWSMISLHGGQSHAGRSFEAGTEELLRVFDCGAASEGELHDFLE